MECVPPDADLAMLVARSCTSEESLHQGTVGIEPCEQDMNFVDNQQPSCESDPLTVESTLQTSSRAAFQIDSAAIQSVPANEQAEELRALGLNVYDQTVLEEGILEQVDKAFQQQEAQRQKQIALKTLKSVLEDVRSVKIRLKHIDKALAMMPKVAVGMSKEVKRQIEAIQKEKENKLKQLKTLRAKQRSLVVHIEGTSVETNTDIESEGDELDPETKFQLEQVLNIQKAQETEQEKLIRTGHMTPFGTVVSGGGPSKDAKLQSRRITVSQELTDFEKYLLGQEQLQQTKKKTTITSAAKRPKNLTASDRKKKRCKMRDVKTTETDSSDNEMISLPSTSKQCPPLIPKPKRKHYRKENVGTLIQGKDDKKIRRKKGWWPDPDANCIDLQEFERVQQPASGSEYAPSGSEDDDSEAEQKIRLTIESERKKKAKKETGHGVNGNASDSDAKQSLNLGRKKLVDDGNHSDYIKRIKLWKRVRLLKKYKKVLQGDAEASGTADKDEDEEEDEEGFEEFDDGYRIPLSIWNKLYRYQQTCVRWLWELHCQKCGGIMGDEMGLGKTIQAIAYLAGLSLSNVGPHDEKFKGLGPVIIVAPTTVMHQWVREFHTWWPPFRVAILHDSGSYSGTKESLVRNINSFPGILVTSYSGIVIHQDLLLKYNWHYIFLDEGHKIRNPDARATLVCKQFRTPHRFILSGSPLQNHLKELWSLFDFIFPGKLGTLPVFMQQFAVPITHGGYSNASQVQVQTAYRCAVVLRDTITPYLLRRMKSDVKMNLSLPNKNEQVLFCRLTDEQREHYKQYLDSKEIQSILSGRLQVFVGLINLRKICNHPDLYSGGPKLFGEVDHSQLAEDMHYGYWKRSGKMLVIEAILKLWHRQGHRVLLFSQSKQMLDILERFIKIQDYTYVRMDGSTSIGSRQPLVNRFNNDSSIFVFLLTTRVGGLGVNLTGANRVVIYDPDWNPSTDLQARERAWRIGQHRDVTIYRLLTSGTIEEKIYHRQIFKQFLTNRVLKDPRQRRFFKSNDLFELFVLRDEGIEGTETSAIFAGTGSEVKVTPKKTTAAKTVDAKSCLSEEKIGKMRELAKRLSQKIREKAGEVGMSNLFSTGTEAGTSNGMINGILDSNGAKKLPSPEKVLKQKKKKRHRGTEFDGVKLDYLDHKDTYTSTGQEQEATAKNVKQDEYVLQKLFAKSGVHTALKHDTIVDASDPDYMLVEGEAERVAKEAVKALKMSRRQCYRAEAGIPTWTGSNGLSGAPATARPKARFGRKKNSKLLAPDKIASIEDGKELAKAPPKPFGSRKVFTGETESTVNDTALPSSQLLLKMKQRNHLNPATAHSDDCESDGREDGANTSPPPKSTDNRLTTEYDELLVDIRNFIAFQCSVDGEASTEEILHQFRGRVPAAESAVFKALLQKICTFVRNGSGIGVWRLNGEFR